MTRHSTVWACVILAAAAGSAFAGDDGLHITTGISQSFQWNCADGAGYNWDISPYGQVNDGTNDCYDGGMGLTVNGQSWSMGSNGMRSKDGREVEIGPWSSRGFRIWRRIYVDPKLGYCRWIDIIENTTNAEQSAVLQYSSNMGGSTQQTFTTSGKADLTNNDYGIVTSYGGDASRPSLAHIFASRSAKTKPQFQWTSGSDNLYYRITIKVPAQKTVALCFFEAQRRGYDDAKKFLKEFSVERETRLIPPALRRILLNMGGVSLTLGRLEIPRNDERDLIVKRNGDEILGELRNEAFKLETSFGVLDVAPASIVGMTVPTEGESHVMMAMTDGQVVAGTLKSGPMKFRLADDSEMNIQIGTIQSFGYRVSTDRPGESAFRGPVVVLRSGQILKFRAEDLDATFHTEYGDLKLSAADIDSIMMDTPEGGLHRVMFRNGSVMSGLLAAETLKLKLDLGPTLTVKQQAIEKIVFGGDKPDGLQAEMRLRNEDVLYGRIIDDSLTVNMSSGPVKATPADIVELAFSTETVPAKANMRLQNGTTVTGGLAESVIRFQITPNTVVPVFAGHVVQIACPKGMYDPATTQPAIETPPAAPNQPTIQPTTRPTTRPIARVGGSSVAMTSDDPKVISENLAKLRAELEKLEAEKKSLSTELQKLATDNTADASLVSAASARGRKRLAALQNQADKITVMILELETMLKRTKDAGGK